MALVPTTMSFVPSRPRRIASRLEISLSGSTGHMARILQMLDGRRMLIVGIIDEDGKGFTLRAGNSALLEKAMQFAEEK